MFLKTVVLVFLVVHVCRTVDCVVGHPRPFLGHRCTVGVLAGTHRCALMPRVASRQSANLLWLLECGIVSVSWWSSKQSQRDFTALLLYAFRVPCLTTILDSWSFHRKEHPSPTTSRRSWSDEVLAEQRYSSSRGVSILTFKSSFNKS